MKIITNTPLKALDGKDVKIRDEVFTFGKAIAGAITAPNKWKGDKIKAFALATKLYSDEEVEVDKADVIAIKKAVELDNESSVVIVGQVLSMLEELKEETKKEETKEEE